MMEVEVEVEVDISSLRICEGCKNPMTERHQPRVDGLRVFQARGRCSNCYQRALESGELVPRRRNGFTDTEIECRKCGKWKNVSKFKKNTTNSSGYSYLCKFCDKLNERYGISDAEYRDLYDAQNGMCAICKEDIELYGSKTHVDHDHSCCPSGKSCGICVRGLLCLSCNLGLGFLKDNISSLKNAIGYLEDHEIL